MKRTPRHRARIPLWLCQGCTRFRCSTRRTSPNTQSTGARRRGSAHRRLGPRDMLCTPRRPVHTRRCRTQTGIRPQRSSPSSSCRDRTQSTKLRRCRRRRPGPRCMRRMSSPGRRTPKARCRPCIRRPGSSRRNCPRRNHRCHRHRRRTRQRRRPRTLPIKLATAALVPPAGPILYKEYSLYRTASNAPRSMLSGWKRPRGRGHWRRFSPGECARLLWSAMFRSVTSRTGLGSRAHTSGRCFGRSEAPLSRWCSGWLTCSASTPWSCLRPAGAADFAGSSEPSLERPCGRVGSGGPKRAQHRVQERVDVTPPGASFGPIRRRIPHHRKRIGCVVVGACPAEAEVQDVRQERHYLPVSVEHA